MIFTSHQNFSSIKIQIDRFQTDIFVFNFEFCITSFCRYTNLDLDSMRISKTTHGTCSSCIHSLLKSAYSKTSEINQPLLSGKNNVVLKLFFAIDMALLVCSVHLKRFPSDIFLCVHVSTTIFILKEQCKI